MSKRAQPKVLPTGRVLPRPDEHVLLCQVVIDQSATRGRFEENHPCFPHGEGSLTLGLAQHK
jgi:hypothetical protein